MKKIYLTLLFILCFISGCTLSVNDKAIITANEAHNIALTEAEAINNYCVPKYISAKTKEDITNADKICLPAEASYYVVKSAWESLNILINSKQATQLQIENSAAVLLDSLVDLKKIISEMK